MTSEARAFFEAEQQLARFIAYVSTMATRVDQTFAIVDAALRDIEGTKGEESNADAPFGAMAELERYRAFLRQLVLSRGVDNYLSYVADILGALFATRPEMLRSESQITLSFVLNYGTMSDLVAALAEREVDKMAYKGLRDVAGELSKRYGLDLFDETAALSKAVKSVDQRNLIVHNRGIINGRWRAKYGDDEGSVGSEVDLGNPLDSLAHLHDSVVAMDHRVIGKFGLPTVTYVIPQLGTQSIRAGRDSAADV